MDTYNIPAGTPNQIWNGLSDLQGESFDGCVAALEATFIQATLLGYKPGPGGKSDGGEMPRLAGYILSLAREAQDRFGHDPLALLARVSQRLAWSSSAVAQYQRAVEDGATVVRN